MAGTGIGIHVGRSQWRLDLPDSTRIAHLTPPIPVATLDLSTAIRDAIAHPIDFPPLAAAVVPGDRMVITIDQDAPGLVDILYNIIDVFSKFASQISVLLPEATLAETIAELRQKLGETIELLIHQPDDSKQLAYLAASQEADPLYLNRHILDADFVLPVAVLRGGEMRSDPAAAHLFPTFADRNSQRRVYGARLQRGHQPSSEPSEAVWLMGLQAMVGIVPASGSTVAAIVAGTPAGVAHYMENQLAEMEPPTETPDLVVACVDGGDEQQTWRNVARAVAAAQRIVGPGGTIAVCTELVERPPASVRRLRTDEPTERILKRLQRESLPDALTAGILLQSREEGRLLIQSQLSRELIEDLGFAVIDDAEDLRRLIEQHQSCAIIDSAQFSSN